MDLLNINILSKIVNKSGPFLKLVERYRQLYNFINKSSPNKLALAVTIHEQIDDFSKDFFENPLQDKPSCNKGCSFCCYNFISVSKSEAKLLAHSIKDKNLSIDKTQLLIQSRHTDEHRWSKLEYKDRRCVFLKNNECSVYENRPASCRNYFVTSNPESCNTGANRTHEIKLVWDMEGEALAEALREKEGSGALPIMLLEQLNH